MYDIFISYKHTDEYGNLTEDYKLAQQLYKKLTNIGYKVFYSNNTLTEIGSSRYKKDIDEALDKTKIMIVLLTKSEYASSKWIQYEWDSFYNDYLSGLRQKANLFTLVKDVNISELPRTLRNVQSFNYNNEYESLENTIRNLIPLCSCDNTFEVLTGKQITFEHLKQAVKLDHIVYPNMEHVDPRECKKWHDINPDIYFIAIDKLKNEVVGYINIAPVTEECYDKIKNGEFITTNITDDMILSYDLPFPYSVYFFSIAIHPEYQNSKLFFVMLNSIIEKFINLSNQEVYIKRMIADAVTNHGEKFCKLFGMKKITNSTHNSTLYEINLIPPKFNIISKKTKELYDAYKLVYDSEKFLFNE